LGANWFDLGKSYDQPFRWMDGAAADVCVFSPAAETAPLGLRATSFAVARHLQVWVGDHLVFAAPVPADEALHDLSTPAIAWPAGAQLVRLVVPEGAASPLALGRGNDARRLSLGFTAIRRGALPP